MRPRTICVETVRRYAAAGASQAMCARVMGVTTGGICRVAKREGITFNAAPMVKTEARAKMSRHMTRRMACPIERAKLRARA